LHADSAERADFSRIAPSALDAPLYLSASLELL
jgi:hypothetical protein